MAEQTPFSVPVNLDILPFPAIRDDPDQVLCLSCLCALDLHQPAVQSPDMLLGVCESCQRWYMILTMAEGTEVVLVRLPDREWLKTAMGHSGFSETSANSLDE
jgi:hypothetical protein